MAGFFLPRPYSRFKYELSVYMDSFRFRAYNAAILKGKKVYNLEIETLQRFCLVYTLASTLTSDE